MNFHALNECIITYVQHSTSYYSRAYRHPCAIGITDSIEAEFILRHIIITFVLFLFSGSGLWTGLYILFPFSQHVHVWPPAPLK